MTIQPKDGAVKLGITSDSVAGKLLLDPEQARAFVDRFVTAAEDLE